MNTKLIKFLASACIGLSLIIAGEWLYASYRQHRLLTSISSEKQQDYKTDELPKIELTKQPEESYVDLVARPLFIEGRKPVNEPSPEAAQAAAKSESFDWQLTGVYSTKKTTSALFSRSKSKVAKDNHRKITVGDDLDGWKLIEINKDRVMLKQGGNDKELLLRKPKLKELPKGAKSPKPPTPVSAPAAIPAPAADTTEDTTEDNTEDTSENNQ
jgi:type II secretory pathway component PulC